MSQNPLVMPFISRLNLITLILVGVLFAAFRLSGGGGNIRQIGGHGTDVEVSDDGEEVVDEADAPAAKKPTAQTSLKVNVEEEEAAEPAPIPTTARARSSNGASDPLDALLKKDRKPAAVAETREDAGLDDIQRQLGLK